MKYFEDLEVGYVSEQGTKRLTKEDIIEFAMEFDPQPFHVDEAAAAESIFGGIIASGLQTLCICNKLSYEAFYEGIEIVAGKGIDGMRFYEPVCPGDVLSVEVEVVGLESDSGPPDRGLVEIRVRGFNQRDEKVVGYTTYSYVARRTTERTY
jgi:acyl dehydratase